MTRSVADLWPAGQAPLSGAEEQRLREILEPVFAGQLALAQLPAQLSEELPRLYLSLAAWLNRQRSQGETLLVGINGSQGSGKTTLCQLLQYILAAGFDCQACVLSIDDFYLGKAERERLATEIHPLLATRGVPGTHDTTLAKEVISRLKSAASGETVEIPRFDKAADDRCARDDWSRVQGPVNLVLFEGWCVGARPQAPVDLAAPINRLEEREDPEGRWRAYANDQLRGSYAELFGKLDRLIMLQIPDWQLVYHWRKRQEQQLAAKRSGAGIMGETELRRFIMHYERLTRHQLNTLPQQADLVLQLNEQQRVRSLTLNNG